MPRWQIAVAAQFLLEPFRRDKNTIVVDIRLHSAGLALFNLVVDMLPLTGIEVFGVLPLFEDCFVLAFPAEGISYLRLERRQVILTWPRSRGSLPCML